MAEMSMSNAWEKPEEYLQSRAMQKGARSQYMHLLESTVLDAVRKGIIPWAPTVQGAMNGSTGRSYRGDNGIMLTSASAVLFDGDPRFYTSSDVKEKGLIIKEGEQGIPAYYFEGTFYHVKTDDDGNPLRNEEGKVQREMVKLDHKVFRPYLLFNAKQLQLENEELGRDSKDMERKKSFIDQKAANALLEEHGTSLLKALDPKNRREELESKGIRFKEDGMIDFSDRTSVSNAYMEAFQRTMLYGRNPEKDSLGLISEIAAARLCERFGMLPCIEIKEKEKEKRIENLETVIKESKGFENVLKRADAMIFHFRNHKERTRPADKSMVEEIREKWKERKKEMQEQERQNKARKARR